MDAKPFLFDEAFDGLDGAEPPPRRPPKKYDEAAVAAERDAAFAAGFAEGEAKGRADAEAEVNERHQNIRDLIAGMTQAALSVAEAGEAAVLTAAPAAAARAVATAFPALGAERGHAEILAAIRDSLARAADEPRLVVRLAEADFEAIDAELADIADRSGFPGKIVSLEDAAIAEGDVKVEWADGGIARDHSRLTEALIQALGGLSEPTEPTESIAETAADDAAPGEA